MTRFRRTFVRATGKVLVQFGVGIMALVVMAALLPQLPRWSAPPTAHVALFFIAGLTLWISGRVLDAWAAIDQAGAEERQSDAKP